MAMTVNDNDEYTKYKKQQQQQRTTMAYVCMSV